MKKMSLYIFLSIICACKKDSSQQPIVGEWVWYLNRTNNPYYNTTPQSTGITEILKIQANGEYNVLINNQIENTGTYKLTYEVANNGSIVNKILYTNQRIIDSVEYYVIQNDTLRFSWGLIGSVGSRSRFYKRK
ncbi:MAG: hypothetical protein IKD55_02035 [Sediminibacterium sp.]|nr:hypothetical protein [Sediminibacterium sp.]